MKSIQYRYRITHSNIPREYLQYTWGKYDSSADISGSGGVSQKVVSSRENAFKIAKTFASNIKSNVENGRSLILVGQSSTGKTVLATLILRQSARVLENRILYVNFSDFYHYMKQTNINAEILQDYLEADVLLLDEIYRDKNDFKNTFAFETFRDNMVMILRSRRSGKKTTILTSRIKMDDIKDIFGESLYRTISDKNYFDPPVVIAEQESDLKIEILNSLNKFDAKDIVRRITRFSSSKKSNTINADMLSRILQEAMVD